MEIEREKGRENKKEERGEGEKQRDKETLIYK